MRSDCPVGPIRDLLPGFVHQSLSRGDFARVESHLASCADCCAEVELIRAAAVAFRGPPLELPRIVHALGGVAYVGPVGEERAAGRRHGRAWLVAAVISFLLIGGMTMFARQNEVIRRYAGAVRSSIGGTSRLSTEQLRLLLREIERVDVRPSTEPEAARRPLLYPVGEGVD